MEFIGHPEPDAEVTTKSGVNGTYRVDDDLLIVTHPNGGKKVSGAAETEAGNLTIARLMLAELDQRAA